MQRIPLSVLIAPVVLAALFATALIGSDRIGFRDVSHFYTPLFEYVAQRQQETWIPLWNDLDHTGIPLAGETTTAVFYPIRIAVYQLPLTATSAIAWYIWIHLSIASISAWIVSRWHGTSRWAACFGSIVYSLSGAVFFLHNNLPFLVSAAWLPLALGPMLCSHPQQRDRRVAWSSVSLSMMILGGDPQAALHCVLILFGVCLIQKIRRASTTMRLREVLFAGFLTFLLACPQLAASMDWSLQSDRAGRRESLGEILQAPNLESPRKEAFAFSIPPWHLAELFSPKPFGELYPMNTRMSLRFSGEARMWVPTLYMGFFVGLSMLAMRTHLSRRKIDRWMLLAMMGLSASLGAYGVLWLIQWITGTLSNYDGSVGGVYWLLYWWIPGYDAFRYPAKWLPFFALGLTISTAKMLDRPSSVEKIRQLLTPAFLTCSLLTIAAWAIDLSHRIISSPSQTWIPKDPFWGPLQIGSAWQHTTNSLLHSSLAGASLLTLFWLHSKYKATHQRLQIGIIIILLIDLSISANHHLLRISKSEENAIIQAVSQTRQQNTSVDQIRNARWLRVRSGTGWPRSWQETSATERALEVEAGGRLNWFGRWHLKEHASVFNSATSIRSAAIASFWDATRALTQEKTAEQNAEFWRQIRMWLAMDGIIATKSEAMEVVTDIGRYQLPTVTLQTTDQNTELQSFNSHPRSTLQVSHQWRCIAPHTPTPTLMQKRLREMVPTDRDLDLQPRIPSRTINNDNRPWLLIDGSKPTNPKQDNSPTKPLANSEANRQTSTLVPSASGHTDWKCLFSNSENASFEVVSNRAVLVTRPIYQDGNWTAKYRPKDSRKWQDLTVGQVDFLKQGMVLPAGHHEIRFTYRPWWVTPSLVMTSIGCLLLLKISWQRGQHSGQQSGALDRN